MKIGVVGSRSRTDHQAVVDFVRGLDRDTTVISGGCAGVDMWAIKAAREAGLPTIEHKPILPPKGSPRHAFTKAYYQRNSKIAQDCDVIVAFVATNRKGGTENTIKEAQKLGKKIIIL